MAAQGEDDGRAAGRAPSRGAVLASAGVLALAVVLYGGYVQGWSWTGFSDNDTLWDWLELLLLPVVVAALPVWLSKSHLMRPRLRRALGGSLALFSGLVVVGYVAPLAWTGFVGNTLWDWLKLVVLPAVLVLVPVVAADRGVLRPGHRVAAIVAAVGLLAAVLGGYVLGWGWTGFRGNTLWDWIQLALLPLIVPTLLTPRAMAWITAGIDEAEGALGRASGRREPAGAPRRDEPLVGRSGRAVLVALGIVIAAAIIGGHAAVQRGDGAPASPARPAARARAAGAAADCARGGTAIVAASPDARVVRAGTRFAACPAHGPAVALGTTRGASGPRAFGIGGGRVVWADDRCAPGAVRRCSSRVEVLRLGATRGFVRRRFGATGGIAAVRMDAGGALAVMIRPPCATARCPGGQVVLLDRRGATVTAQGPDVDPGSLASEGRTVFWLQGGAAASARLAS